MMHTRQEETRRAIVEAAYETFLAFGYDKTTISDIARAAGVSRPTLYRLYEDKAAVFLAVVESLHREAHARYTEAAHTDDPLASRLAAVAIEKVETVAVIRGASVHGPELLDVNQRIAGSQAEEAHERLRLLIEDMFAEAWAQELEPEGELGCRTTAIGPEFASRSVMAIIDGWTQTVTSAEPPSSQSWRPEMELTLELLVSGIRAHADTSPTTKTGAST